MGYDVDDCEPCSVYREKVQVAQIEHKCSACHEPILPGATYKSVFAICDGQSDFVKRCARCEAIYQHLKGTCEPDWRLNCGHEYRELWECEPPPEIAALAFALPGDKTFQELEDLGKTTKVPPPDGKG